MSDGPNMQAAKAVADLLNAESWPAAVERPDFFQFNAQAVRFPKWKNDGSDFTELVVVTIPAMPYTITIENRGDAVNRECPVNVVVALKTDRRDAELHELLAAFVDAIAELLITKPAAGFGYPDGEEGVEVAWDPDELEETGVFFASVGAVYGRTEEIGEED